MTNDDVLKLAGECGMSAVADPEHVTGICYEVDLIAFANAVRAAALEEAAEIAESAMSDDHKYAIAAAIRGEKNAK